MIKFNKATRYAAQRSLAIGELLEQFRNQAQLFRRKHQGFADVIAMIVIASFGNHASD